MKILFVVQRYGVEVGGGAEQHCRWLAEGLASRGHQVVVATSRALNYMSWSNHYPSGEEEIGGVTVRRFGVSKPRDVTTFNELSQHLDFLGGSHPIDLEDEWLSAQGPDVVEMPRWLEEHCSEFDVVVPFTYLYRTTQVAIDACAGKRPIWMHATAHDEPPFHLRRIREYLGRVDGFLCSTPEEQDLLRSTISPDLPTEVVGIGVSLARPSSFEGVLSKYKIPLRPYCLILGRVDASKGVLEGIEFFRDFKRQSGAACRLVVVGQNIAELPSDDEVTLTGFVEPEELTALLMGAEFLIQPSYYESFSLALCESWLAGVPTLSNGNCEPVAGQTGRSGGGLLYHNRQEFLTQATQLHRRPRLRRELSRLGRSFVQENFLSEKVLDRIERLLVTVAA